MPCVAYRNVGIDGLAHIHRTHQVIMTSDVQWGKPPTQKSLLCWKLVDFYHWKFNTPSDFVMLYVSNGVTYLVMELHICIAVYSRGPISLYYAFDWVFQWNNIHSALFEKEYIAVDKFILCYLSYFKDRYYYYPRTNPCEIGIKILQFPFRKFNLKTSSSKWC